MSVHREIQVVIVGAGIGGLSVARLFQQTGIQPVVIEAAEEFDDEGEIIELWPETIALLDQLGIADDVRDVGTLVTEWTRRHPDGTVVTELDTDRPGGVVAIPYERLREQFVAHLDPESVRMGTTLRSLTRTERPVSVTFENGVRESFDLVVGADGVTSRTRELLGGSPAASYETTSLAIPLPPEQHLTGVHEVWTADGTVFRAFPAGDRPIGMVTIPEATPENSETARSLLQQSADDITWALPDAFELAQSQEVWFSEDFYASTDIWAQGRVALVGDAAHARHRLTGMGPTLAIEDAAVLVSELLDREDTLSERLADYAARRQARMRRLPARPTNDGAPQLLEAVDMSLVTDQSVAEVRGGQLATAFGSGTSHPAVNVSVSRD